jgi:hypothetical protein
MTDRPPAEIVLTETAPLRFWGVETGSRMTVVRLASGGLFVHSPIALNPALRERVAGLGEVVAIVAPSKFHHLSAGPWAQAWPGAVLCGCPGVVARRPDLPWHHTLRDEPHPLWEGQLSQVHFAARSLEDEVVFFVPGARTMVCADAVFHLGAHPDPLTRCVAACLGNHGPGATWLERLLIRDRAAAREQVGRMVGWDVARILLAHGPPVEAGGRAVLERAYGWL